LDILASAVPELLVEIARLRAIIDEFMRLEGRPGFPAELFVRVAMPWARCLRNGGMAI
jgi:hypothetical protein